jgi:hypothetical protein
MWSTVNPPKVIRGTPPLKTIEDVFEISLDDDIAWEIYNMRLDEAAQKIMDLRVEQGSAV